MLVITVLGVVLFLFVFLAIGLYNRGVSLRNYVRESFSTMDVYLKKRWDLIPNLIEIVEGYTNHEKETLEKITELRSRNYSLLNAEEKMDLNSKLDLGLSKLIATAENYPDLKANQTYAQLMTDLSSIEAEIANSRRYYNGTVRELNNYTECFPSNIIALLFGIKQEKMFEIDESQRENVKVQF